MKKLIFFITIILFTEGTNAQYKIDENFDYSAGDSLGAHGWTAHSGGSTNRLLITTPGLTYAGYPLSGIGNAVTLTKTGQDAYINFGSVADSSNTTSVYVSCMVKVTAAQRQGDYFLAFLQTGSTTFYEGRLSARIVNGIVNFGITKGNASTDTLVTGIWTTGNYNIGNTYLLILKYTFIEGISNDAVSLFVFTSGIPSTEPAPTLGPVSAYSSQDASGGIGRIALRQGTDTRAPDVIVDGIRVSTSWFKTVVINLAIQGLFVPLGNQHSRTDTVSVYLRRVTCPYDPIDSFYAPVNSKTLIGPFEFVNANNGPYYLEVRYRHLPTFRNGISTWSKTGGFTFTQGSVMQYDFTTSSSQAYGNNQILIGTKYCIYSGDINQDEVIDASDLSEVDNDANNSVTGYVRTDLTGDDFVDAQDLSIVDNNAYSSVSAMHPLCP